MIVGRKLIVALVALVPAWIGLWLLVLQVVPRPIIEGHWIADIYSRKEAAAAKIQKPKVVLIGGSATHYSYSARVVAKSTGLPVVNLGTHAGLGTEYLLHRTRASLNPGDTAVVALEHSLVHQAPPSSVLAIFIPTGDPGYLLSAPLRDLPALLFGYPPSQVIRQVAAASVPWTSPLYRAETVDAWGDETVNTPANKQPYMLATVHSLPDLGDVVAPANPDSPPRAIIEFAAWAKQNNIRLLQAWPVTTFRPAYLTPRYTQFFARYEETFRRLGFEVLGSQVDSLVPEADMLDSMNHADVNGAERVSKALAINLCRAIDCPVPNRPTDAPERAPS